MLTYPATQNVPLISNDDGVIRVEGTRLGLELIVDEYNSDTTPEIIAYNYAPLSLADVYAVIAYYLARTAKASAAAAIVASISSTPCTVDKKPTSNCDGAR